MYSNVQLVRGARVIEVLPEPVHDHVYVNVEFVDGGKAYEVKWPGPNFEITSGGSRGVPDMMHGIYVGPKEGQLVSIGFENGRFNRPIILNVYPHEHDQDPQYEQNHLAPMVQMGFSVEDIAIAHYSGSYIALRSDLMPGDIEVKSIASVNINSDAAVNIESTSEVNVDSVAILLGDSATAQPILRGIDTVAELEKINTLLNTIQTVFTGWVPVPGDGGAVLKAASAAFTSLPLADYTSVKSDKVQAE
jgi:hypothetical protein